MRTRSSPRTRTHRRRWCAIGWHRDCIDVAGAAPDKSAGAKRRRGAMSNMTRLKATKAQLQARLASRRQGRRRSRVSKPSTRRPGPGQVRQNPSARHSGARRLGTFVTIYVVSGLENDGDGAGFRDQVGVPAAGTGQRGDHQGSGSPSTPQPADRAVLRDGPVGWRRHQLRPRRPGTSKLFLREQVDAHHLAGGGTVDRADASRQGRVRDAASVDRPHPGHGSASADYDAVAIARPAGSCNRSREGTVVPRSDTSDEPGCRTVTRRRSVRQGRAGQSTAIFRLDGLPLRLLGRPRRAPFGTSNTTESEGLQTTPRRRPRLVPHHDSERLTG